MSEHAKKARDAMKAKAKRLAAGDPHQKVDSSTWTPPEALNADKKTGMRPVSKRAYKKGGKVIGKCEGGMVAKRADRKARKSGGRTEEQPIVDRYVNRDMKKANEYRDGTKHIGGLKKGGRTGKMGGGVMGDNPISQQNRSMSKAAGMAFKKGGKAKRHKYATDGGVDGNDQIGNMIRADQTDREITDLIARDKFGDKNGKIPLPPRRQPAPAPKPKMMPDKYLGSKGFGYKKGGKAEHDDEAADKALIKKMVKPEARTGKYTGGGIFSGNSKQKVPGVTGGRKARKGGGRNDSERGGGGGDSTRIDPSKSGEAYYDFFTGWHDLDKATPDQIAHMRPDDAKAARAAMGRNTPNKPKSSSASVSRTKPIESGMKDPSGLYDQPRASQMDRDQAMRPQTPAYNPYPDPTAGGSEAARYGSANAYAQRVLADAKAQEASGGMNPMMRERVGDARRMLEGADTRTAPTWSQTGGGYYTQGPQNVFEPVWNGIKTGAAWLGDAVKNSQEPAGLYNKGGRAAHKKGGRAKGGVTIINIETGKSGGHAPLGAGTLPNAPVGPRMPNAPQQPMGGAGAPPMGAGGPPMPPAGGGGMPMPPMPMGRKTGGRTTHVIDHAAGGGLGRQEKIAAYGLKPAKRK
jgi:hypothetical protein